MKIKDLLLFIFENGIDQNSEIVCDGYEKGLSKKVECTPLLIYTFFYSKNDTKEEGVYSPHKMADGTKGIYTEKVFYIGTGRNLVLD